MIPSPWELVLLVLAAYRLTRLVGWDEFPLAARARAWIIGERWVPAFQFSEHEFSDMATKRLERAGITQDDLPLEAPTLPGKQPSSEAAAVRPAYDRPTLAHLIHCPFCVGFWISLAVFLAWLAAGDWALVVLCPFAVSGAVGVVAKNLDA